MSIKLAATLITAFTLNVAASTFDLKTAKQQMYTNIKVEREALLGERGMKVFNYMGQFHPQSHLPGLFEKEVAAGNISRDSTFAELQERCPKLSREVQWAMEHYTGERKRAILHLFEQAGFALP
jgi:hypothetical protein